MAEEQPVVVKDHSVFTKILKVVAVATLVITLVLAGIVLFGSDHESAYIDNRETFYSYGFICTIIYFVSAYWAMKRGKTSHSTS
ncbi:hypothetical protein [[Muricauda] lutisoli]|uniref:Uncharacterized protein n=1 Tax=[Muricauda] lutisoli TaxID=2816035 RepID=A0ABS3EY21_9FLAO|nr:hypothetical protein [[Muricauda] lutisoli]MBO0331140.1 hypothetical protein [[Muricauda] lutisoli]